MLELVCLATCATSILVGTKRFRGLLSKPHVENLMRGNREQPLVLDAQEIDRPANAGRQLLGHTTVNLHAAAAIGRDTPAHHAAIRGSPRARRNSPRPRESAYLFEPRVNALSKSIGREGAVLPAPVSPVSTVRPAEGWMVASE